MSYRLLELGPQGVGQHWRGSPGRELPPTSMSACLQEKVQEAAEPWGLASVLFDLVNSGRAGQSAEQEGGTAACQGQMMFPSFSVNSFWPSRSST